MKGGWLALEQAGRLVTDATVLYETGSYSTAAALALLSREELAKSRRLFEFWVRVARRGEDITREQAIQGIDAMEHRRQAEGRQ